MSKLHKQNTREHTKQQYVHEWKEQDNVTIVRDNLLALESVLPFSHIRQLVHNFPCYDTRRRDWYSEETRIGHSGEVASRISILLSECTISSSGFPCSRKM